MGMRTESPSAFRAGALAVSPVLLGVIPFGLIAGIAPIEAGLGLREAIGFSSIVFAGAAQLAAIDLIGRDAPIAVAVGTALVINARFLMYSASLAPELVSLSMRRRAAAGYLLTDQAYAMSMARFARAPEVADRWRYYLGAALTLWVTWQLSTIAGVFVGDAIPSSIPIAFGIPLTFLALLIPAITDRPTLAAALIAGSVAVAAAPLPSNLGLLVAALAGIVGGTALSMRRAR